MQNGSFDELIEESKKYLQQDSKKAETFLLQAFKRAANPSEKLTSINQLLKIYSDIDLNLKEGMKWLRKAESLDLSQLSIKERIRILSLKSKILLDLGDFTGASQATQEQLNLLGSKDEEDWVSQARATYMLGSIAYQRGDYEESILQYFAAKDYYEMAGLDLGIAGSLDAIAISHGKNGDLKANCHYDSLAVVKMKGLDEKYLLANIYLNYGYAKSKLGAHRTALDLFRKALQIGESIESHFFVISSYIQLGGLFTKMELFETAGDYLDLAKIGVDTSYNTHLKKTFLIHQQDYYNAQSNFEEAYKSSKRLLSLKDSLSLIEKNSQIENNLIRFDFDKRELDFKKLEADKLVADEKLRVQRFNILLLLCIVILAVAIGIIAYSSFLQGKKDQLNLEAKVKESDEELAASHKELKKLYQDLEQSTLELERFAFIASHDLQSPLRNITSFLNLLEIRLKGNDNPEVNKFISIAVDNAKQMQRLINDMVEYSRLNDDDLMREEVDLNVLLVGIIDELKERQFLDYSLALLPNVIGNTSQFKSVFQNIIENAVKFNRSPIPTLEINHEETEKTFIFSIKDNGIGINKDYFSTIFGMFKKLHAGNEFAGTGIGLSLTQKIVRKLGGEIWLESEEGKGSTFFFSVPKNLD